ncbi:hypothetical protein [Limnobaculum parvum]|uniref:Uncharacterized protein n=1 Tax=Limnobaculum parvum TaxID=2172103 RepID=A0A2Y9TW82_9GAMM|nr:hypothetical protein [Limnobaculum parvum]AWH87998.1 hypothetical protein HYN51_05150 [Limnobaculum parvum]
MTDSDSRAEATTTRPALNWNTLFRGDRSRINYNACVGNNGSPDIYFYADGFADSVTLLIEDLEQHRGALDTLIYPICFSLRHSVELTIKGQIQDLVRLSKIRKQPLATDDKLEKVLNGHDIQLLWDFFVVGAVVTDRRYVELLQPLTPLIKCIADTDPTGQTFRYSYSTEAVKHLTDVSVINIQVLREVFELIREQLDALHYLTDWLISEYRTGTFTRHLSREELMIIARQLPPRVTWRDVDFDNVKASIKSKYDISNRELSKALMLIQQTRDMAVEIGLPISVPGLSTMDFVQLNDIWKIAWDYDKLKSKLHDYINGGSSAVVPVHIMDVIQSENESIRDAEQAREQFHQWTTPEKLAGLYTLLDAGCYKFPEDYDKGYSYQLQEMNMICDAMQEVREAEINDIWIQSIGHNGYPARIIRKLKIAGFKQEAFAVEENLFAGSTAEFDDALYGK